MHTPPLSGVSLLVTKVMSQKVGPLPSAPLKDDLLFKSLLSEVSNSTSQSALQNTPTRLMNFLPAALGSGFSSASEKTTSKRKSNATKKQGSGSDNSFSIRGK